MREGDKLVSEVDCQAERPVDVEGPSICSTDRRPDGTRGGSATGHRSFVTSGLIGSGGRSGEDESDEVADLLTEPMVGRCSGVAMMALGGSAISGGHSESVPVGPHWRSVA